MTHKSAAITAFRLLTVLALLNASASAQQPVAGHNLVYATFSVPYVVTVPSSGANGSTLATPPSLGIGVTLGSLAVSRLNLGLDIRASSKPGGPTQTPDPPGTNATLLLGGLKVSFPPPQNSHIVPWMQFSGGDFILVTPISPTSPGVNNQVRGYATYAILLGMDYNLNRRIGIRLFEAGGGRATGSRTPGNQGISYGYFASGVTLHF